MSWSARSRCKPFPYKLLESMRESIANQSRVQSWGSSCKLEHDPTEGPAADAAAVLAHVVDCGSGFSRIWRISCSGEGELTATKVPGASGPRLAEALKDPAVAAALLGMVGQRIAPAEGCDAVRLPLAFGATAGVWLALGRGDITTLDVDRFRAAAVCASRHVPDVCVASSHLT